MELCTLYVRQERKVVFNVRTKNGTTDIVSMSSLHRTMNKHLHSPLTRICTMAAPPIAIQRPAIGNSMAHSINTENARTGPQLAVIVDHSPCVVTGHIIAYTTHITTRCITIRSGRSNVDVITSCNQEDISVMGRVRLSMSKPTRHHRPRHTANNIS